ncbi:MAG: hypothetical protein EBS34_00785 [Flavobacteriales bacterium]|nr:hypothetical protein [Flavobacteriales bacterium]
MKLIEKYKIPEEDLYILAVIESKKLSSSFFQKEKLKSHSLGVLKKYNVKFLDLGPLLDEIRIGKYDQSQELIEKYGDINLNKTKASFGMKYVLPFIIGVGVFVLIFKACGPDKITGTSDKSYLEMVVEVGCTSSNSDDKKEDIFREQYKNKWMTFVGVVEGIDGDVLSINCDMQGISDVRIEFDDEKSIYEIKKGTLIKVKFAMRKIGGCIESFQGDKGEIVQKDLSMSEMQNEMFKK